MKIKLLLSALVILLSFSTNAQLPNGSTAPNFTLTDLNGNTHDLYTYLDHGKVVYIEFFACHCPSCWAYHNTNKMKDLYTTYGPDGTDQIMVLMLEHDEYNGDAFHGLGGYTQGDWITGNPIPMIDVEGADRTVFDDYNMIYYPMVYKVCPDKTTELMSTSLSIAQLYQKADDCPGTLSIKDPTSKQTVYIDHPNAQLNVIGFDNITGITLLNSIGQSVLSFSETQEHVFDISLLSKGIYFIQIEQPDKLFNQKIYYR